MSHTTGDYNLLDYIDSADGHDFEQFCAQILTFNGFEDVEVTQESNDQGIDIIATKHSVRYAIQCKRYSQSVGNSAIQEAFAGKSFYNCHLPAVMTNQDFTNSAMELANKIGVILWGRNELLDFISVAVINGFVFPSFLPPHTPKPTQMPQTDSAELIEEEVGRDELYNNAVDVIIDTGMASVSMLQRRLKLRYSRAARLMDQMEEDGVVGPFQGVKPREVLLTKDQWRRKRQSVSNKDDISNLLRHPNEPTSLKSEQIKKQRGLKTIFRRLRHRAD